MSQHAERAPFGPGPAGFDREAVPAQSSNQYETAGDLEAAPVHPPALGEARLHLPDLREQPRHYYQ
jgi:hypothetical protein